MGRRATGAERPLSLTEFRADPVGFVTGVLGESLWSRQREIAEALRDHRRVAVPSCHDAGKSFLASRLAAWWIATGDAGESFVVTSAPTNAQVKAILWREIKRAHRLGQLPGTVNRSEWLIDGELVGYGRKPNDWDMTGFQGIHAARVLVIFDEASGVPQALWDAAETLITNEASRLLAIGNPDDPAGPFARACAPGGGFLTLPIDAFKTPNLTGETIPEGLRPLLVSPLWVEEMRVRWGEESPLWQAKVRGRFPDIADDRLLSPALLQSAVTASGNADNPVVLGVDIARFGRDETVLILRRGDQAEIYATFRKQDTMVTVGRIIEAWRTTGAVAVQVDDAGVGGGVTDRLREQGAPVVPILVGRPAREGERFLNLRAELYWGLRERAAAGRLVLPQDDLLLRQLGELRYRYDSRGRLKLESKDEMKKRGVPSPDRADALALAFAPLPEAASAPRVRLIS
ncbi:hypothetical protein [Elstera cyanobacteriorum]|uniref:hypothetical protein n=1 Tax=Elstera cyanobacteriorum TaxID=2022747 RepID=UPI002357B85B|nr:hypothetical protein [Elstera cyanobacteriorum]MCK6444572.1 hypothetical protein [Elstera cyanobacteriorum]